jgi:O-antigen ligase
VSAAVIGFACVAILGFDNGGYFERSWRWAILAFVAVTALALVLRNGVAFGRLELVFLGALGALAAWTLLSSAWGIAGTEAAREAERVLVYVAGSAALLAVLERTAVRALLVGVMIGTVAIATVGLGDRLLASPKALNPLDGTPLVEPLGYANALGIVVAIGLVIALGLLLGERRGYVAGLIIAAVIVLAVALALTASRGAWLALGCGVIALALLQPRQKPHRVERQWLAIGAAAFIAIAVLAALALRPGIGVRSAYWRVAISDASAYPLAGSGAGSFDDYWTTHRTVEVGVQDAHSIYLETLAELGLVGFVLLVGALASPLIAIGAARSDPNVAIAAAGYIAFLVHAGLDWDWEMPATTLTGLACAAALLAAARPFSPRRA